MIQIEEHWGVTSQCSYLETSMSWDAKGEAVLPGGFGGLFHKQPDEVRYKNKFVPRSGRSLSALTIESRLNGKRLLPL